MEFDEKDLRREISYAIKNIHGVRQVLGGGPQKIQGVRVPPQCPLGAFPGFGCWNLIFLPFFGEEGSWRGGQGAEPPPGGESRPLQVPS